MEPGERKLSKYEVVGSSYVFDNSAVDFPVKQN